LVLVLVIAAVTLLVGAIVGWVLGRRRAQARARAEAALASARHEAQLGEVKVGLARLEERYESSTRDGDRLRTVEKSLRQDLLSAEQEKARLDYELRQVGLIASRVPELEARLGELEGLRRDLQDAQHRVAELEPVAAELELRNQFIETLQRELSYRDERLVALESKVDGLQRELRGESPIRRFELVSGSAAALSAGADTIDLRDPAAGHPITAPTPTPNPAAPGATPAGDDLAGPPVSRALEQALSGLGVRSFADLACVADGELAPEAAAAAVGATPESRNGSDVPLPSTTPV
jgi:flagellar biosynthesis chaperone FliJ